MKKPLKMLNGSLRIARLGLLMTVLAVLSLGRSPLAHADTLLKAATVLVVGSSADTLSFDAPGSGTITAQISSTPWPVPLSALSFSVTTATNTLSSWSTSAAMEAPQTETFQVSGGGTYFAHVMATAAGSLDLGLYSVMVSFSPSAVPLPGAAGMLLIGMLVLFALRRTMRVSGTRNESVMSVA